MAKKKGFEQNFSHPFFDTLEARLTKPKVQPLVFSRNRVERFTPPLMVAILCALLASAVLWMT